MPRLLPRLLGSDDLPIPELIAARLDGQVFTVDDCFAAIDEPDSGWLRATSLALTAPNRVIVERASALWLHGVHAQPPLRHQLCIDATHRVTPPWSPRFEYRECVLEVGDVVCIGPLKVTSPLRTAVDLLRTHERFDDDEACDVHLVLRVGGASLDDCVHRIRAQPQSPGTRRALERLSHLAKSPPQALRRVASDERH